MRTYKSRPASRSTSRHRNDDEYDYERDHPTVFVDGERQSYWSGLYDHRGEELWVSDYRPIGFVRFDDDDQ